MPAGSTYTPIATTTAGGSSAVVTFSSIPSTYTDLVIVCNFLAMSAGGVNLTYNNDTGANYSNTEIYGDGSTAVSARGSSQRIAFTNASNPMNAIINVQNYANSTTYKTLLNRWNSSLYTFATVGLWRSTASINRIDLTASSNIAAGSTFTLYGIAAA